MNWFQGKINAHIDKVLSIISVYVQIYQFLLLYIMIKLLWIV